MVYEIREAAQVPGYTVTVTSSGYAFTVKNSHTPETIDIPVEKIWNDDNNHDGKRTPSVTVRLYADGAELSSAILNSGNNWKYSFTNLDKNKNGKAIVYTLTEDAIAGYSIKIVSSAVSSGIAFTVENTHTNEKTQVEVKKVWDDNNNHDAKRPVSVTVHLYKNGTDTGSSAVLSSANNWKHTFTGLDKYENGKAVNYSIVEDAVDAYTVEITSSAEADLVKYSFTVTNTHNNEKTKVEVEKVWTDNGNQDGKRPDSVKVYLYADGTVISSAILSSANNWKYSFANLDKYSDGKVIRYEITEDAVDRYTVVITSSAASGLVKYTFTVNNTHNPEKTQVAAEKIWVDNNNHDGKRPVNLTVYLKADGAVVSSAVLNSANNWKYTFQGLDKYKNGKVIAYSVTEDTVERYSLTVTSSAEADFVKYSFTLTNTHNDEKTRVEVKKVWNDSDDQDGKRPASVSVHLFADGTEIGSAVLSSGNNWKYSFEGLDKYKDGKVIAYNVTEDSVDRYSLTVSSSAAADLISYSFTLINTHGDEKTLVEVEKVWVDNNNHDGKRPENLTVYLHADGAVVSSAILNQANNWKYTFTNLDKYKNGKAIVYTVTEETVEKYVLTVTSSAGADLVKYSFTLTNTHGDEKTRVEVQKVWADNDNRDGKRPLTLTVYLHADGAVVSSAVLNQANNWKYTFSGLDKYKNGKVIAYSITEDTVERYSLTVTSSAQADLVSYSFTLTNTHGSEKTQVEVEKIWVDNNNHDGKRPVNLTVYLYADGAIVSSAILNSANNWKYTFSGLDKYKNGKAIVYNVTEDTVERYGLTVSSSAGADLVKYSFTLTNTHGDEKTRVEVKKVWEDNGDQDGKRPLTLTVYLYADGAVVSSAVLSSANNWKYTFEGLDKYKNGKTVVYNVTEDSVDRYYLTVSSSAAADLVSYSFTLTNTHSDEKTRVEVKKVWEDDNNHDGKRPAALTVYLRADGVVINSAVLNQANNWKYTFDGLDKYKNGKVIAYSVTEDTVERYALTVTSSAEADLVSYSFTLTNKHENEKTRVEVQKVWADNNANDGKRPLTLTVYLHADGAIVSSAVLNSGNSWKYTFEGLDKYENGRVIAYDVTEETVAYYSLTVTSSAEADLVKYSFTLTNTHDDEKTQVKVQKIWVDNDDRDGMRPDDISVELLADGVVVSTAILNTSNAWTYTFGNLNKLRNGGIVIIYSVKEQIVPEYTSVITSDGIGFVIKNTHDIHYIDIPVEKKWVDNNNEDGIRPIEITVKLYADGVYTGKMLLLSAENAWKDTFLHLEEYNNGKKIVYTVKEVAVTGYTPVITSSGSGFIIENRHTPKTTRYPVCKIWVDGDNRDGKRPVEITVKLLADGVYTGKSVVLSSVNNWESSFENLEMYSGGKLIIYSVEEVRVDGYTVSILKDCHGFTITNTYEAETTEIPVRKVWEDSGNQDGIRPEEIVVKLYADGKFTGKMLLLSEGNDWKGKFEELDKYRDGKLIEYTVKEVAVNGYSPVVTSSGFGFIINNYHVPETTSFPVRKIWVDGDNSDGLRPVEITVKLYADGVYTGKSVVLSSENNWESSFDNLDKYANGKLIDYTVEEIKVNGYTSTVLKDCHGFTITNTVEPRKTQLSVRKIWLDDENKAGKRPESITVKLLSNGRETGRYIELNESNNWSDRFVNLDAYENGRPITYTIKEVSVPEYVTIIEIESSGLGYVLTNVYYSSYVDLPVEKIWVDDGNVDGIRPASIEVRLLANGMEAGRYIVLNEANGWKGAFKQLPVSVDGVLQTYSVMEITVPGYTTLITSSGIGFVITNTHTPKTVEIPVEKIWLDNDNQDLVRPADITVHLLADGVEIGSVVLSSANNWKYTFTNLPENREGGEKIVYTVSEDAVEGYSLTVTSSGFGFLLINTHTTEKTELPVEKRWSDEDNTDGIRPTEITVLLLADGAETGKTLILSAKNKWKGSFENLDRYRDGAEIVYTVREVPVPGYSCSITQISGVFVIENVHVPGQTRVPVEKRWNDGNDAEKMRPLEITVELLADGVRTGKSIVLSSVNKWAGAFENLPAYKNGRKIVYTVSEVAVTGYTSSVEGNAGNGFVITNTHTLPKYGKLVISKLVTGIKSDRAFSFRIVFSTSGSFNYTGTLGGETVSGTVKSGDTVYMKHGDRIEISGLPEGTTYRVTEGDNKGFTVYEKGSVGIILPETEVYAAFTNTIIPETGDKVLLWCLCGAAALITGGTLVYRKKKKDTFED